LGTATRTRLRSGSRWPLAHADGVGALTTAGVLASMTIESATDGDIFLTFVEQVLAPRLEPGHVVILDNLGAH